MSRRRIVTGVDERGRPIATWEDVPALAPAYGHMEPAYSTDIERRRVPPAGNGATPADRPALGSPAHLQQSRLNGARRHQEVMAKRAGIVLPAVEEDPVMSMPVVDEPIVEPSPFDRLAQVAAEAAAAHQAKRVADAAWSIAVDALAAAWADVGMAGTPMVPPATPSTAWEPNVTSEVPDEVVATVAATLAPVVPKPKRQPGRHPGKPQEAQEKAARSARVIEAMGRLGGDQRAVAAELGMKVNAVAMVVKHARLRGELA